VAVAARQVQRAHVAEQLGVKFYIVVHYKVLKLVQAAQLRKVEEVLLHFLELCLLIYPGLVFVYAQLNAVATEIELVQVELLVCVQISHF